MMCADNTIQNILDAGYLDVHSAIQGERWKERTVSCDDQSHQSPTQLLKTSQNRFNHFICFTGCYTVLPKADYFGAAFWATPKTLNRYDDVWFPVGSTEIRKWLRWTLTTHIISLDRCILPTIFSCCVCWSRPSMSLSRRPAHVALGIVGTLAALNGVKAGWTWLENTKLVNHITRETCAIQVVLPPLFVYLGSLHY